MPGKRRDKALETDLMEMLSGKFHGITVTTEHSERWGRMSVAFRWVGFADLLPEERFHRLATAIPSAFRESRMAGFVWLELAPKESIEAFLKLPRSEDIAQREGQIHRKLKDQGFFDALSEKLGRSPGKSCGGDFGLTAAALSSVKASSSLARDAKLLFIGYGAYCDCQVLESVKPAPAGI